MRSLFVAVLLLLSTVLSAAAKDLVAPEGFVVYTTQKGDTWKSMFPDERYRELAMKVNRMNVKLGAGQQILLPTSQVALSYVPVPESIASDKAREIVVYRDIQYFGAYEQGRLVRWGPVSTGRVGKRTPTGTWSVKKKQEKKYSSYGGAPMPFSVGYNGKYYLHGQVLPGKPASRGCVRMLTEDAKWHFRWIKTGDTVRIVQSAEEVLG